MHRGEEEDRRLGALAGVSDSRPERLNAAATPNGYGAPYLASPQRSARARTGSSVSDLHSQVVRRGERLAKQVRYEGRLTGGPQAAASLRVRKH